MASSVHVLYTSSLPDTVLGKQYGALSELFLPLKRNVFKTRKLLI